jgi:hypothetical protein
VDIGNIENRSEDFDYVSIPFDAGTDAHFKRIEWTGLTYANSAIKFQVRFGSSREQLLKSAWVGPKGPRSFFAQSGSELPQSQRWVQYKATLVSPNGAALPILKSVTLRK